MAGSSFGNCPYSGRCPAGAVACGLHTVAGARPGLWPAAFIQWQVPGRACGLRPSQASYLESDDVQATFKSDVVA